jgi:clan AA aspartic protease
MSIKVHDYTGERTIIGPGRRINCPDDASMDEVRVEIELENFVDRGLVRRGQLAEAEVRAVKVRAIVDTGAVMLMLPRDVVEALGLDEIRSAVVTCADNRKEELVVAGGVTVRVGSRSAFVECLVGPPNSDVLLGQIPLEAMDLLVDCGRQELVPRPESPFLPLLNLK